MSQLHLSPNGRTLTFERGGGGPVQLVGVDLSSGQEKVLPLHPNGTRYFSADGRTMLDLGSMQLFDTTDPMRPRIQARAPETLNGCKMITAAVSDDGSLIAVELLEAEDNPSSALVRVVVFDRKLKQSVLVLSRAPSTVGGLQFEGRHLLVGVQRHPIPAYFDLLSTSEVRLYDLSKLF